MSGKKRKSQRVETAVQTLLASLAYNFARWFRLFYFPSLPPFPSLLMICLKRFMFTGSLRYWIVYFRWSDHYVTCGRWKRLMMYVVQCSTFDSPPPLFPFSQKKRKGAGLVLIMPGPVYPRAKDESFIDSHIKRERLYSWVNTYRTARNI